VNDWLVSLGLIQSERLAC